LKELQRKKQQEQGQGLPHWNWVNVLAYNLTWVLELMKMEILLGLEKQQER
jgi:hypothetical protein